MKHLNPISEFKTDKLIAPNGRISNLSAVLYEKVRTPEFKKWFGDWENDPENSSKVVDANGEPLVVYHGTPAYGFDEFLNSYDLPRATSNETNNIGIWFISNKEAAKRFMFDADKGGIYEVFINIRNPKSFKSTILNRFEIEKLNAIKDEVRGRMTRIGWSPSDMTKSEREEYARLKEEEDEIWKKLRILRSVDSFEQFMNYRDKYAKYIDGVEGEEGYWHMSMINTNKNEANKKLLQEFKQDQHDGIMLIGTSYDALRKNGHINQYVVFDPKAIKSVDARIFNAESTKIHESEMKNIKSFDTFSLNESGTVPFKGSMSVEVDVPKIDMPGWDISDAWLGNGDEVQFSYANKDFEITAEFQNTDDTYSVGFRDLGDTYLVPNTESYQVNGLKTMPEVTKAVTEMMEFLKKYSK